MVVYKQRASNPSLSATSVRNRNNARYIATRPGVLFAQGQAHGLFGRIAGMDCADDLPSLDDALDEVTTRGRRGTVVYRSVLSLAEGDTLELGLMDRAAWTEMIGRQMPIIAEGMNIPVHRLGWIAAIHFEAGHPHAHMLFWDDGQEVRGYYTQPGRVDGIRRALTKSVFRDRLQELYAEKNAAEWEIKDTMLGMSLGRTLAVRNIQAHLQPVADGLRALSERLPSSGRLSYGFMPPEIKAELDALSRDLIGRNAQYRAAYANYLDIAEEIAGLYSHGPDAIRSARDAAEARVLRGVGNELLRAAKEMRAVEQDRQSARPDASAVIVQELFMRAFAILSSQEQNAAKERSLRSNELSKEAKREYARKRAFEGQEWEI